MDDCSTEDIKVLVKDDKRIKVLQTPKNVGSTAARNAGLSVAIGRYIIFLDSDDTIDSDYL